MYVGECVCIVLQSLHIFGGQQASLDPMIVAEVVFLFISLPRFIQVPKHPSILWACLSPLQKPGSSQLPEYIFVVCMGSHHSLSSVSHLPLLVFQAIQSHLRNQPPSSPKVSSGICFLDSIDDLSPPWQSSAGLELGNARHLLLPCQPLLCLT